jgi:hypothetical protein
MPDADDFDVEYFRNLLRGNTPKEAPESPASPPHPVAKKKPQPPPKPAAAKKKSAAPAARKKGKAR